VSRRRERGVALLAAVTALAVMSALAVGLAHTTVVDQHLTTNALEALQADALARSGVAIAAVVLGETGASGAPDTLASPWARDVGRQPIGAGFVELQVEDAARRLDLSAPELADALPRLLRLLDLDPGLADAIADWTDADDDPRPHGAERDWYRARTPPYVPRNGPLATPAELGLVRGIDGAVLDRLRPYVTVAGEHAVNPNTASREVLLAVLDDAATVERLLTARARGPLDDAGLTALIGDVSPTLRERLVTRGQRYVVRSVARVGALTRGVEATLWAPEEIDPTVVMWRRFVPQLRRGANTGG
jgi:general secretion pathway protein K